MTKVGFIGTGNMGGALALSVASSVDVSHIFLSNKTNEKAQTLKEKIGERASCSTNLEIAENCDYIFLGVKPNIVASVLSEIASVLADRQSRNERFALVSMAAGLKIETLQDLSAGKYPVIRIMPNTPVYIGNGVTLLCNSNEVEPNILCEFEDIMKPTGLVVDLDEQLFDVGTALSGCGPAFVYMFADALSSKAAELGIEAGVARKLALATISGAADLAATQQNESLENLKRAVCSPRGATLKGVEALDAGGFNSLVGEAVEAACKRSQEMSES